MKALYFNCKSGISGDMVVGALLDLGKNEKYLIDELKKLNISGFKVKIKNVLKKNIKSKRFIVETTDQTKERNLSNINEIINRSKLSANTKTLSKNIFLSLAKAEAKVHKISLNKVHFHEVGAIDSIIDIVSASILLNKLKPDKIFSSRISVGSGKIKFSHGITTLPVPAVKELLKNVPLLVLNINKELTTPTGAAIIITIANEFADDIIIDTEKRGFGAGFRDLPIPNVLEVQMGEFKMNNENLIILETNIDDMNPEYYSYIIDKLISEGAEEAFISPVIMKKNRIGTLFTIICKNTIKNKIIEIIFNETTTFGIRLNKLTRIKLEREIRKVKTKYGVITLKIGRYKGITRTISPEFENCKAISKKTGVPIKIIYEEAKLKYQL